MYSRALLTDKLRASHQALKACLADLSGDESQRIPSAAQAPPIIWHVGHVAVMNAYIARMAGTAESPVLPTEYAELFKMETGGAADYPPLAAVTRALDKTHEAVERAVAEANLDAPFEGPGERWTTLEGMFVFAHNERWYHIGAITSIRALLGKPSLPDIESIPD